jgi:hypothetical protein
MKELNNIVSRVLPHSPNLCVYELKNKIYLRNGGTYWNWNDRTLEEHP